MSNKYDEWIEIENFKGNVYYSNGYVWIKIRNKFYLYGIIEQTEQLKA